MKDRLTCPPCGRVVEKYRNPFPTVDIIIELPTNYGNKPNQEEEFGMFNSNALPVPLAFDHEKILKDYF